MEIGTKNFWSDLPACARAILGMRNEPSSPFTLTATPAVEVHLENTMKIASCTDNRTRLVGKRCDRCGHRVKFQNPEALSGRTAVSLGAELGRFISVDLDEGHLLHRADLCEACAASLLDCLRAFLPAFRPIASEDPASGLRTFSYRVIDAETDRPFQVSSLFDDGA